MCQLNDQVEHGHKAHGVAEQERLWHFAKIQAEGHAARVSKVEAVVKVSHTAQKS